MDRCSSPVLPKSTSLAEFSPGNRSIAADLVGLRRELFAHALRLTREDTLAEDLVQDTMERALRFEDRFERGTNLRAWVHQILLNVYISRCRRRRREGRALQVLSTDPCAWTANASPVSPWNDLSRSTRRAIHDLPNPFRTTILLVDVQELSYKDAAEQLAVPIGTVMSRLHRARRLLAEALRDDASRLEAA